MAAAWSAVAALVLTGCGGGDEAAPSGDSSAAAEPAFDMSDPAALADEAMANLEEQDGLRISVANMSAFVPGTSDGEFVTTETGLSGSFKMKGNEVHFISAGGKGYMQGSGAFWKANGLGKPIAEELDGQWLTSDKLATDAITSFTIDAIVKQYEKGGDGSDLEAEETELNGEAAVKLSSPKAEMVVAGDPLLPQSLRTGAGGDNPTDLLLSYDDIEPVEAPADAEPLEKAVRAAAEKAG